MHNIEDIKLIKIHESGVWKTVTQLLLEYAESLDIDLSFQNFENELQTLPELYGLPYGGCILAVAEGVPAGCVAFKKLTQETAEMKRLYVRESFRGLGIGKTLVRAVLDCAGERGYAFIRLDTLPQMGKAQQLYSSLGFYDIPSYTYNPIPGTRFMELKLKRA